MGEPFSSESKDADRYFVAWRNILSANVKLTKKIRSNKQESAFFKQGGKMLVTKELLDIAQVISFANQANANVTFIRGTRWEEAFIYGALDLFLGIIIVKKSQAYVLLRNPENINE